MAPDSIPAPVPSADVGSDPEDALDIGSAVGTGVKWKVITQFVSEGSCVVVSLVLARLLTPAQYGVAGMAMVCVSFASMFSDPALGTALVQRRRITEADRSTVSWVTNAIGALLMVVCIGVSGYVRTSLESTKCRSSSSHSRSASSSRASRSRRCRF